MNKPIRFSPHTINVVSTQMAKNAINWLGVFIYKESNVIEVLDLAILAEGKEPNKHIEKSELLKEMEVLNLVVKAAEVKAKLGFVWGTSKNTLPSGLTEDTDKVMLCITRNEKEFIPWFIKPKGN